ncbi:hypothetical protein SERLA73DRAFT_66705, partial [Serpula lacrymans var. lacrymans S7.3]
HSTMRINYTSYNVRRGQDVINSNTSHNNVMVLAGLDNPSGHHFWYARVLGIYHANIIYTGPGMVDYQAHCLDFLWVRWYEPLEPATLPTSHKHLEKISFVRMDREDVFGFLDPAVSMMSTVVRKPQTKTN